MLRIALASVCAALMLQAAQAAITVAHWGFDTYTGTLPNPILSDQGVQQATARLQVQTGTTRSVTGTTLGDLSVPPAASYAMELSAANASGGMGQFTITVSSYNLFGISLQYTAQKRQDSPSLQWYYSRDNSTWTALGTPVSPGIGFVQYTAGTVPDPVNNLPGQLLYFRAILQGSGPADIQFDNINILAAVPEPVNVALALFGVVAVGGTAGYRFVASRKAKKA